MNINDIIMESFRNYILQKVSSNYKSGSDEILFCENMDNSGIIDLLFLSNKGNTISEISTVFYIQQCLFEFFNNSDISNDLKNILIYEISMFPSYFTKSIILNEIDASAGNIPQSPHQNVFSKTMGGWGRDIARHWGSIMDFYRHNQGIIDIAAVSAVAIGAYHLAKKVLKDKNQNITPQQIEYRARQAQIKQLQKVMSTCNKSPQPDKCRNIVLGKINKIKNKTV